MDAPQHEPLDLFRRRRRTYLLFWLSYALFIAYVTTLPFDFIPSTARALEKLSGVSHHLFTDADGSRASFSDMVQNMVLFAPFGALTILMLAERAAFRLRQDSGESKAGTSSYASRPGRLLIGICTAGIVGFALSVTVETLQLFTADRVTSLNDVVTNTTGAVLGALAAAVVLVIGRFIGAGTTYAHALHELYPVLVWGAVLVLAAWHPFDTTIDISGIASKVRAFVRDPWQRGALGDEGVDAIRYALFSVACVVSLRRLGFQRPRVLAALAGSAAAAALEFSQFFVQSRMPGMKDVSVGIVGSCLAATLALPRLWSRRVASVTVAVASVLATALMTLSPLVIQSDRQGFQLFPLRSYAAEQPELAISHAAELSLAFFPVGFALAFVVPRRHRMLRVALTALVLGGVLEYLQGWIVGRYPDVTDVAVLTLGALAGTWAASNVLADGDSLTKPAEPSDR